MRLISIAALFLTAAGAAQAGDLHIHVMLSGEVAPGVYGQVQIVNERPANLVYTQPLLIEPQAILPPPVYLHVPPGHATHWRRHCREYNACDRPVYFVRSDEYEPGYGRRDDREHDAGQREDHRQGHDADRDHQRGYDHDHERAGREHHDEG